MKTHGTFEDLYVWKEAIQLAKEVFALFENCTMYSLRNQIERAALSISTNIAEGHELGTTKQLVKHLYISKGSCGEVRSILLFSKEIVLFDDPRVRPLIERCRRLSIMIYNMIKSNRGGKDSRLS